MNATFITKQHLDDVDRCMSLMSAAESEVSRFKTLLAIGANLGTMPVPWEQILGGQKQATVWRRRDFPGTYQTMHTIVAEAVCFASYLISQLSALSPVKRTSPVSTMSRLAPPPGPAPTFADTPMTDCLQLFRYHMNGLAGAYFVAAVADKNYSATRDSIIWVLPRLIDFTSAHLHTAEAKRPPAAGLNAAREFSTDARRQYTFGINGISNLLTQQHRITIFLGDAGERFLGLEALESTVRFKAELGVIEVTLKQVQRYCSELLALRDT